jgi:hypothetical protein
MVGLVRRESAGHCIDAERIERSRFAAVDYSAARREHRCISVLARMDC